MKIYIVTSFDPSGLQDRIIKLFSTKENLDRWLELAKLMAYELTGDEKYNFTSNYRIREAELDNLDFVELYAEAHRIGAQITPVSTK